MENPKNTAPNTAPFAPNTAPQQPQVVVVQAPHTEPSKSGFTKATEASHKTFSVIGLIAVLGLLSYGIVMVTPGIIRSIGSAAVTLSSIFIPAPKFSVTADNYNVNSGQPFTLSWAWPANTADSADQGSYTVSYPCIDGLHLEATNASNPSTNDVVFCNTAYHFLNNGNTVTLVPFIAAGTSAQSISVPVTIYFTKNGDTNTSASVAATIVVANSGVSSAPTTTTTGTTVTTKPVTTVPVTAGTPETTTYTQPTVGSTIVPSGISADLTATILATGVVSTTTNAFTAESPIRAGDRGAIQFSVENIGGKASGSWSFAVVLPTFPAYTFQSQSQPSLAPGDKIEYTIGFDGVKQSPEDSFVINVDNTDIVNEQNKTNNIITGDIFVNLGQ